MNDTLILWVLGLLVAAIVLWRLELRLELSLAKHRSLAGHARMSRWFSRLVPFYEYDESEFFRVDGAPVEVEAHRRAAFERLAALFAQRFAKTARLTTELRAEISDLQFTSRYRVPF